MTLSVPRVRHYLKNFDLEKLFIEELGWDRHTGTLDVQVDGRGYSLQGTAEKRGVQIFQCQPTADGKLPDYSTRRKIAKQVTKSAYAHLIIFADGDRTTQIWQWVARQPGQPAAYREHTYYPNEQSGDALIQKLDAMTIPLDKEEALDLTGTVHKLRDAFDRDRVTKRFYDHFKRAHGAFLAFIKGITEQGDKAWYASLMLNRLMFVYFIQKKGFLDSNPNYLQDRLQKVQAHEGKGKFLSFYRYFLLGLFHEGFSKPSAYRELDAGLTELLGDVPYLNGGLFALHALEEKHPKVDIPDEAFEKLFAFFDQYKWHLDTRPLRNDREINPDVLGYIFEKYINQKQMGAYYTKEDITDYISKNTIIPYLFDAAKKQCAVAFEPGSAVWRLLQDDPERYLYAAVRQGVLDEYGEVIPLPEEIATGMKDVSKRAGWNRHADLPYALPTETWREHVARRQRCLELREKLQRGEISQINDLITYNLDIRQFVEDVIGACEGPELLRAFYQTISSVTVLDPACGSGAFLFAALNILEPLYDGCLDRMQAFVGDLERSDERYDPRKFSDFRRTLAEIDQHPNRAYFIFKSIVVNNLYGVDIMEEAVEICKLRLFLNLVAQVDKVTDLEPLPDIDFNIRPGNTLVGFARLDNVKKTLDGTLGFGRGQVDRIVAEAEIVARALQLFHEMQTEHGMDAREFATQKQELRQRLNTLTSALDRYLAGQYDVDPDNAGKYAAWRRSHQPFHWCAEFYGIMQRGGFSAVIGNPPYIELKVVDQYTLRGFDCISSGNLYAVMLERSFELCNQLGRQGCIVPVSSVSTDRYVSLQDKLSQRLLHYSSFDDRPSRLFDGLQHIRLTIHLIAPSTCQRTLYSTRYNKWHAAERTHLFHSLRYAKTYQELVAQTLPKLCSEIEHGICQKLRGERKTFAHFYVKDGPCQVYFSRKVGYFLQVLDFEPRVLDGAGNRRPPSEFKVLRFGSEEHARLALCCLNSNVFYWFITVFSDCRHVNKREIDAFPIDLDRLAKHVQAEQLIVLAKELMEDLEHNSEERQMKFSHDTLMVQCIVPKHSKNIIDAIDASIARYYCFTTEEYDFIVGYDLKYRIGAEAAVE